MGGAKSSIFAAGALTLNEGLRVGFGTSLIGAADTIDGIVLVLCIIFMPRGIVGTLPRRGRGARPRVVAPRGRRVRRDKPDFSFALGRR